MEVDTTKIKKIGGFKRLSPEEQKKLQSEGRCFKCKRQGHMARACPGKGQSQSSKLPNLKFQKKPSARITEMADEGEVTSEEEEEARSMTSGSTKVNKAPSLMAQINKLGTEDKEAIFARLINKGF
jgi:Zinc knuckle